MTGDNTPLLNRLIPWTILLFCMLYLLLCSCTSTQRIESSTEESLENQAGEASQIHLDQREEQTTVSDGQPYTGIFQGQSLEQFSIPLSDLKLSWISQAYHELDTDSFVPSEAIEGSFIEQIFFQALSGELLWGHHAPNLVYILAFDQNKNILWQYPHFTTRKITQESFNRFITNTLLSNTAQEYIVIGYDPNPQHYTAIEELHQQFWNASAPPNSSAENEIDHWMKKIGITECSFFLLHCLLRLENYSEKGFQLVGGSSNLLNTVFHLSSSESIETLFNLALGKVSNSMDNQDIPLSSEPQLISWYNVDRLWESWKNYIIDIQTEGSIETVEEQTMSSEPDADPAILNQLMTFLWRPEDKADTQTDNRSFDQTSMGRLFLACTGKNTDGRLAYPFLFEEGFFTAYLLSNNNLYKIMLSSGNIKLEKLIDDDDWKKDDLFLQSSEGEQNLSGDFILLASQKDEATFNNLVLSSQLTQDQKIHLLRLNQPSVRENLCYTELGFILHNLFLTAAHLEISINPVFNYNPRFFTDQENGNHQEIEYVAQLGYQ